MTPKATTTTNTLKIANKTMKNNQEASKMPKCPKLIYTGCPKKVPRLINNRTNPLVRLLKFLLFQIDVT